MAVTAWEGETIKSTLLATADYSGLTTQFAGPGGSAMYQAVVAGVNGVTLVAAAGQGSIKVLTNKPKQNDPCRLVDAGETKMVAGAAIAVGQPIMTDSSGRFVPYVANGMNVCVGEARSPASVLGDIFTGFIFAEPAVAGDPAQYTSIATGNGALTAAQVAGAPDVTLATSGATALTTPTAAQIIAQMGPNWQVGASYRLRVINTNAGTLTLTGGTGVTINGTATLATATFRDYLVTLATATTITMQNVGAGTS